MAGPDEPSRLSDDQSIADTPEHGVTCVDVELGKSESRYPGGGTGENPFVVDWDPKDPENPFNWSRGRKWLITLQVRCQLSSPRQNVINIACVTGLAGIGNVYCGVLQ